MKPRILTIALIALAILGLESCKKYPEGPGFTVRSKKDRLANEWVIQKVITNTQDVTHIWVASYPDFLWTIKKDYVYEKLMNGIKIEGTWAFDDDQEKIIFEENGSPTPDIYEIYRLRHTELWLYQVVGGGHTEMHLIPKQDD